MLTPAHSRAPSWDRSAALAAVVALHIGGIWFVWVHGGLGRIVERTAQALQVVDVASPEERREPPPPIAPPRLVDPRIDLPVPVADLAESPPLAGGEITVPGPEDTREGRGGSSLPSRAPPTPLRHRETRPIDDFYPAVSIRMGEEGAATVRTCVGPEGRLQAPPEVTRSSGHARLDAAALAWASESLAFTAATRDGSPVTACKEFRVRFQLR